MPFIASTAALANIVSLLKTGSLPSVGRTGIVGDIFSPREERGYIRVALIKIDYGIF